MSRQTYWCELAWLPPGRVGEKVAISVEDGRFASVEENVAPLRATRLAGLTLPGFANTHSHAFHRALRGRTQGAHGTFWTWREHMYELAARLDPDSYLALARAVYAEMVLAGISCVGEFHYLHHGPNGTPYATPNAFGHALIAAAREAGLRITLLDTCYLTGGIGQQLEGVQRRFGDGDAQRWADRVDALTTGYARADGVIVGAAIHSVRAVPLEQMPTVVEFAHHHLVPLHAHVSEQRAENAACLEAYGSTPVRQLYERGALGPRTTAVHATHLTEDDIATLGGSGGYVCVCPTTERDLGDGIGPARRLHESGAPVTLGTDSHAVVDMFEEARAVELHERLATEQRGHWTVAELLHAATAAGHASLAFPDAGVIAPGARADLVSVRLDSVRTAGVSAASAAELVVYAATTADVGSVIVDGRRIVVDGVHETLGDVGGLLAQALRSCGT